ncbi:phage major capsid protein [Gordonia phthalatica]|uniref:Capsid protein n=2 Tax=Gordonia TaxID=2053 RepID=A0A0N9MQP8_9ACTN|nr:phage major capsid protein [Gordonia phthalatica]ALG84693.1 capsid protein [Gordonia phthalatica]KJR08439.1 capsid protein [Gordonia sihwensis]
MTETTATNGALLKEQVASLLVQPLEAASVVLAAGPKIFDSSEPLRIPRVTAGASVGWVGESELIPAGDVEFDEINLMPSTLKSIKTLIRFSNELARQSVVGLDAVLRQRLVTDVANKLDDALLGGDGAANTVTGLINQTGVSTGVLDVTEPDSLLDALAVAASHEIAPTHWMISGADFYALSKIKDADGRYLITPDLTAEGKRTLFGVPVIVTNKLATGKAMLVDMSNVAVVRDLQPSVTVLSERYADYDEQAIRVVTRYDLGLLHPEAVTVLTAA